MSSQVHREENTEKALKSGEEPLKSLLLGQERDIAAQFYTVFGPRVLSVTACRVSLRFLKLQFVSL